MPTKKSPAPKSPAKSSVKSPVKKVVAKAKASGTKVKKHLTAAKAKVTRKVSSPSRATRTRRPEQDITDTVNQTMEKGTQKITDAIDAGASLLTKALGSVMNKAGMKKA